MRCRKIFSLYYVAIILFMKFYPYFLLLMLSDFVCQAQTFNFNHGGTSAKNYYEKMPYESINGKIFVYVKLEGKKHKFLFDTGAPVSITNELADELKAQPLGKDLMTDVNGITDSLAIVALNDLKIGNLSFKDIPALILSSELYQCWRIDGVIGSNLLRNSIVEIDRKRHLIILTDQPAKLSLNSKKSVPLTTNTGLQSIPFIPLVLKNNVDISIQFDTGDNDFLRLSEKLMNDLDQSGAEELLAKSYGATSIGGLGLQKCADKYLMKIPFLTIDSCRFRNVISETQKGGIPGIGSKLLNYGTVTLDFINGKFYFDPFQSNNDMGEKQWPFQPTVIGDQLVVGVVWDKAGNQVSPGEQIIAVNGIDYSHVDLCDLLNKKPILAGMETATITLKDEHGSIRKVIIRKE